MALTNVVESAKSTIAREARRANQKYAQKAIASAITYRNKVVANKVWEGIAKFTTGSVVSNSAGLFSISKFVSNVPEWKPW